MLARRTKLFSHQCFQPRNLVLIGNRVHLRMRDELLAVSWRGAGAVNAVVDAVLLAVTVILMAARKQPAACVQPASNGLLMARSSLTFTGPDSDYPT